MEMGYVVGHDDSQTEEAQCPAPQTIRKGGGWEQFHENAWIVSLVVYLVQKIVIAFLSFSKK